MGDAGQAYEREGVSGGNAWWIIYLRRRVWGSQGWSHSQDAGCCICKVLVWIVVTRY